MSLHLTPGKSKSDLSECSFNWLKALCIPHIPVRWAVNHMHLLNCMMVWALDFVDFVQIRPNCSKQRSKKNIHNLPSCLPIIASEYAEIWAGDPAFPVSVSCSVLSLPRGFVALCLFRWTVLLSLLPPLVVAFWLVICYTHANDKFWQMRPN